MLNVDDRLKPLLASAALLAVVTGCASSPFSNPFSRGDDGDDVEAVAEEEPDDGRVPVLALQQDLEPDPQYSVRRVVIPPAFANASWSQPGGEADHVMHHLSAPAELTLAWQAETGERSRPRSPLIAPPIVADGLVFSVDTRAQVTAIDAENGDQMWQVDLAPDVSEGSRRFWQLSRMNPSALGFGGGVAYDRGTVFMVNGFAQAAALDARTGNELWRVDLNAPVRNPPTAVNGVVYLITTANEVVALDQVTGETKWSYASFEENARFLSTGSPAVDGDLVVVPFSSGEVVALSVETGRLLWNATVARSSRVNALSNLNDIAGSPVIDRGAVFAVSHSGQMSAIDGRTGQTVWEVGLSGLNMPWVSGDFLFVVSVDGQLVCLTRDEGGVVWTRQLEQYERPRKRKDRITWMGPVLAGDALILTSSAGEMVQVDPRNGEILTETNLRRGSTIPPVVAEGTVYVLNERGRIEAWR